MSKKLIFLFLISVLLINVAYAQSDAPPCGYTCGSNACQQVTGPAGCQATCPDPPDGCVVCTTSCQGDCVQNNPSTYYYSACFNPDAFDWTNAQNLNAIPPDVIAENYDKIGNRVSDLTDAQKAASVAAIEEASNLPPGSIDISACTTQGENPLSCGITVDANGNIILSIKTTDANGNPIDIALTANQLEMSEGASVSATYGPPPAWQFNIPANGEINYAGVILKSTDGGTITWDGTKATLCQGCSLTYTGPATETTTTVFSKEGNVDVYFGTDVPEGKTGVAINGPASNGNGMQVKGVNVAVTHTTSDGQTIGIITDRMAPTEEVLLKKVPDQGGKVTYAFDLTKAGYSNVKFTDGFEGLTYDAGTMFQCNQATGSCPYDTEVDITLLVTWKQGGTTYSITVQGQSGITGANIVVCPCDTTVSCDGGCVCDMICGLCDPTKPQQTCLPEWMWITFGYANYLKCTTPTSMVSCTSAGDCCQAYGAPYKPYKPVAFKGRADVCEVGKQYDTCGNLVTCKEDSQRRCFNPNTCIQRGGTYCEKSCGYCNKQPKGKDVTLVTNISQPIQNIHYADYINDEHSETATYEIVSQSNLTVTTCAVVGALCRVKTLISNLTIQCSIHETVGNTTLTIRINDECGTSVQGYLKIAVINATTDETASQLGIYVDSEKQT